MKFMVIQLRIFLSLVLITMTYTWIHSSILCCNFFLARRDIVLYISCRCYNDYFSNEKEGYLYQLTINGALFDSDNCVVFLKLELFLILTSGWSRI